MSDKAHAAPQLVVFRPAVGTFRTGEEAFLGGRWRIGWAGWDKVKGDDLPYSAYCELPGLKPRLGRFATLAEAKDKLDRAAAYWLEKAGLGPVRRKTAPPDLVAAKVTTPHDGPEPMTPYDRLTVWAYDNHGDNVCDFSAEDAEEIAGIITRLATEAGY